MSFSDPASTPSSSQLQRTPNPTALPPRDPPDEGLSALYIAPEPRWPHPNLGWSLLWCLLFVLVTQIPGGIIAIFLVIGLVLIAPDKYSMETLSNSKELMKSPAMNVALALAMFLTELFVIGFSWLVIRLVVGWDWMRYLALRRPNLAHTLLALASVPAVGMLGDASYYVLRHVLHVPNLSDFGVPGMEEMVNTFSSWPWGFAVLVIGLGPGIGEELWCRGFLGRGLVGNYGVFWGVLATSFFFGLIHFDPCQGTMAMVMGLWLHFVYLTTRSLWLPMLVHFLNNSLAVLLPRSPLFERMEANPADIPVFVYLSALLLLIGVATALYQSRARLAPQTREQLFLWRPAYEGVEYPPSGSGTCVTHPTPSLPFSLLAGSSFVLFALACVAWAWRT